MNLIRASLLCASLALVAACGASGDQPAATGTASAPSGATSRASSAPAPGTALTEADARTVVNAAEKASKDLDMDAAIATLSDDVHFTFVPPPASGAPSRSIGRDQIVADMRATAAAATERAYSSQVGEVRMAADGASAAVDVAVSEQMTYQGHRLESTSNQTYTVENRQGQAKIVAMTSRLTGMAVDGVSRF